MLLTAVDRAGQISGIVDINSRSTEKPIRTLPDKAAESYRDW